MAIVLNKRMMIGPAAVLPPFQYLALVFKRPKRAFTDGIGDLFRAVRCMREGKIVDIITLEHKRSFLVFGRKFPDGHGLAFDGDHIFIKLYPIQGFPSSVIEVGRAVVVNEHIGINTGDTFYIIRLGHKGTCGSIGNGYTNLTKTTFITGHGREIEIVLPVFIIAVRSPHAVAIGFDPGYSVVVDNFPVVRPVGKVCSRVDMVIMHTKPVVAFTLCAGSITGRVDI